MLVIDGNHFLPQSRDAHEVIQSKSDKKTTGFSFRAILATVKILLINPGTRLMPSHTVTPSLNWLFLY